MSKTNSVVHALKTVHNSDSVVALDEALTKRIQKRLLQMMIDIADKLEKNNIRWCLSGGSIIGAVRHHGFIPWDSDIDLFMERAEFEKLKSIFSRELGDRYELRLPGDQGHILHLPQIHDKATKLQEIQSIGDECGGVYIDIFIYENTYNNKFLRTIHGIESSFYLFVDSSIRMKLCRDNILKYSNNDEAVRRTVDKRAKYAFLFSYRSIEKWLLSSIRCFSRVKRRGKYIVVPSGGHHFFGEVFEREKMCRYIITDFETEKWYIPEGYDYYLKLRYGNDYMTVPPESDRERHVYARVELGEEENG